MLRIGNAPLSWGVFEGDARTNPPWELVLDEIAEAGYQQMELGPIGFLPEDPEVLGPELVSRGLTLTGGFVYEHLHDSAEREVALANARRVARVLEAHNAEYLVVIDRMVPERQRTAGRGDKAERLAPRSWGELTETVAAVARIASEEFGLRPVLHPHCGSHIEFSDEIERAVHGLEHETIGLCVDTAHSAVAGMQPADLVELYAERVEYLHLKDVDRTALERLREGGHNFDEALGFGLFCPLGEGIVDFVALRERLAAVGYGGPATVEQDPDPRGNDHGGLDAAARSLEFLRSIAMASQLAPRAGTVSQREEGA